MDLELHVLMMSAPIPTECHKLESDTLECNTLECNTLECNTLECNTLECNTLKFSKAAASFTCTIAKIHMSLFKGQYLQK
jgi:hypothetical protein